MSGAANDGSDAPRAGPVARLLGSLANALLDLGLPTIRQWLRDRIGPAADVAHVATDGALVHLDGVRIPIGPHGLLLLDRASALVPSLDLTRAGLPELRLYAFTGVLAFGDASHAFRADVSFTAAPEPEESAWIWGELAIRNASWTTRVGSPPSRPMHGHARLFVSSREWRLDGGRLEGEVFRGHFAGSGSFESGEGRELGAPAHDAPLVPPALSAAALTLAQGRVGPFLDALSGLAGKEIAIPSFVPLDAALDGELSWTLGAGGRVDLHVASASIRAAVQGAIGPSGRDLDGRIEAQVKPALVLRASAVSPAALPRDEDTIHVELDIGGELRRPEVKGTLRASEIGLRLGRPRFVPPVVLTNLTSEVFVKQGRAVLSATAHARSAKVTLDVDALVHDPKSVRGTLRAPAIDAAFLRDVVRTLGAKLVLPDDATGAVDLSLAPVSDAISPALFGSVTLGTSSSRAVLDVDASGKRRISGMISSRDLASTGLFRGAIVPAGGDVVVALDVVTHEGATNLHGTASSNRLVLALRHRPEVQPYIVEDAAGKVVIGPRGLGYDDLRFRAHGGRFVARGTIPFASSAPESVLLDLELDEGGAPLAEALARLARTDAFHVRVARDGQRPRGERWVPSALVGRGRLTLRGDLALRAVVALATPSGSALELDLRLGGPSSLVGSTLAGDLALADAMTTGFLAIPPAVRLDVSGIARIDALVVEGGDAGLAVLLDARSDQLVVTVADAVFVALGTTALVRFDSDGVMWNRIETELADGAVRSSGVMRRGGQEQTRVSFSRVAVHQLPAIGGREPSSLVRGLLSGTVVARFDEKLRVAGDVMLDEASFPALDRVRSAIERYGLRPPNEDAVRPVTAAISGTDWGVTFREVSIDLHGASVRGEIGLSRARTLDGRAEVTLEEEYLRTSKLLTLPRALADRIVLPVRIGGTLEEPRVHAGLKESLERYLKDSRVGVFVTSAVEEAQLFFGRDVTREPEAPPEPPPQERELDAELRAALDTHFDDWELLRRRAHERPPGVRIG